MVMIEIATSLPGKLGDPIARILLAGIICGIIPFVWAAKRRWNRVYKKKWFDLSEDSPNQNLNWCEVKSVMETDPLCFKAQRRFSCKHVVLDVCAFITLLLVVSGFFGLIYLSPYSADNLDHLKSLAIFSGVLSFAAGVFSIIHQGRLKARSENRQAWINSIREDINTLLSNIPSHGPGTATRQQIEIYASFRIRFEIFLNPSEPVHRGLLAIVAALYGIDNYSLDKFVQAKLGLQNKLLTDEQERKKWRERATKLSWVLLKREWEQVKTH